METPEKLREIQGWAEKNAISELSGEPTEIVEDWRLWQAWNDLAHAANHLWLLTRPQEPN